jgi:hypothetical protein
MKKLAWMLAIGLGCTAHADGPKPYQLKTAAVSAKVGIATKTTLKIETAPGSHVSPDAPLKITLKGAEGLTLVKEKLVTEDIVEGKGASPSFELAFTAAKAGPKTIDATLTFFVCTKELCERETDTVSIPVDVQ